MDSERGCMKACSENLRTQAHWLRVLCNAFSVRTCVTVEHALQRAEIADYRTLPDELKYQQQRHAPACCVHVADFR
jgi:hypothetical protein